MTCPRTFLLPLIIFITVLTTALNAVERFPPPDFTETNHQLPNTNYILNAQPRANIWQYIDIALLASSLTLAVYFVIYRRSRKLTYILMIFSLLYFGFIRRGCVCSIGSIQNVTLATFNSTYILPLVVLIFFLLPIIVTLFWGRVFCAAVCPLGAIQDFVLLRPLRIPVWLESALRLIAYIYLALAVIYAATGTGFLICRYDPFVSFFRFSGPFNIIIFGLAILVIALFVGRPYCRFLCPYGVILRQFSRLSRRKISITPDECINCRLCENACPFNAIGKPTADWPEQGYHFRKKLLAASILLLPLLIFLMAHIFAALSPQMAQSHPTVHLARQIKLENTNPDLPTTVASRAFRAVGKPVETLYLQAEIITGKFRFAAWLAGACVGLIAGLKLIDMSIQKKRTNYYADPAGCLACGRCYQHCPREQLRLK